VTFLVLSLLSTKCIKLTHIGDVVSETSAPIFRPETAQWISYTFISSYNLDIISKVNLESLNLRTL
jgi:hypothetical protein